jgi:hypothetical protein
MQNILAKIGNRAMMPPKNTELKSRNIAQKIILVLKI